MAEHEQVLWTWLHLSDIHAGHGDARHGQDQKLVFDAMAADIAGVDQLGIPQPEAIMVTGDLAFSGATRNRQEYDEAATWLRKVASHHSIGDDQIFVVPGNHDVQRDLAEGDRNWADACCATFGRRGC